MSQYDVAVLGDGIAALVARLVLVQQCPELDVVTVRPPKPKVAIPKVGEHLPWAAQSLFEELGLWPSFTNQDYVQVNTGFSVWGSGLLQQQHTIGARRAGGWGVDRRHFEAWLAAEVDQSALGAANIQALVRRVDRAGDNTIRLNLDSTAELAARFFIDATGRKAVVARGQQRRRIDKLIGVYNYFLQVDGAVDPTAGPLIEARPDGWLYSALLPARRMIVCWFTDADLMPRHASPIQRKRYWSDQLESSSYTLRRLESAGYRQDESEFPNHFYADASSCCSEPIYGKNWVAVGDAAMTFDPLSSHGMVTAMWSGSAAAKAIVQALQGQSQSLLHYDQAMAEGYQRYLQERQSYYAAEQRFAGPFWQRRGGGG